MGEILGDCITRGVGIIREVNLRAEVLIWSDMLDPNHNGGTRRGNFYYHVDEPFTGVDPIAVEEIQEILRRLKARGLGVLITDHNVRETLHITDRAYIMNAGQILVSGDARTLVDDPIARKVYLGQRFTLG